MSEDNIEWFDAPWGKEGYCKVCGSSVMWEECWNCEDGFSHHDCGEDTCNCIDPQPNVICDICHGTGGWYICIGSGKEPKYCTSSQNTRKHEAGKS